MTIYATFDATALFAGEKQPVQRPVTVAAGQNAAPVNGIATPLKRGALLGRVTASDKYILCVKTASDGSQNPVAILSYDLDASTADAVGPAYFDGEFAGEIMTIDPSWTIQTLQTALRQAQSPLYVRSVGVLG